jgi:hypothetical protein
MIKICVLQRSWIVVGDVTRTPELITIRNARVIRRWATKKGLAELVNGPNKETILDDPADIEMHPLMVVYTIDVNQDKWKEYIG